MALLIDLLVYGVPIAIGLGALRYYGGKPPEPNTKKPEPDEEE